MTWQVISRLAGLICIICTVTRSKQLLLRITFSIRKPVTNFLLYRRTPMQAGCAKRKHACWVVQRDGVKIGLLRFRAFVKTKVLSRLSSVVTNCTQQRLRHTEQFNQNTGWMDWILNVFKKLYRANVKLMIEKQRTMDDRYWKWQQLKSYNYGLIWPTSYEGLFDIKTIQAIKNTRRSTYRSK